jgi:hypothetical protein
VALAAAGLLAAGALTGCRNGATPFAYSGVARGDIGMAPTSPAFAQVAAGQRLAADPKGHVTYMTSPMPAGSTEMMAPGTPLTMTQMTGQPIVGSGGVVYPVGYTHGGQMIMAAPTTGMQQVHTMPMTPTQTGPVMPTSAPQPTGMPTGAATFGPGGQMLLMIQGPNGPQYAIAEVLGPVTAAPQPMMPAPAPAAPTAVVPPPIVMPAAAPAMTSSGTPFAATTPPPAMPVPEPVVAPTIEPPVPASVAAPILPPIPPAPSDTGKKAPDPLPPGVNVKPPAGPVLPVVHAPEPMLGTFPAAPSKAPSRTSKLPPATGAVEGDIPAAPIFVPAPPR